MPVVIHSIAIRLAEIEREVINRFLHPSVCQAVNKHDCNFLPSYYSFVGLMLNIPSGDSSRFSESAERLPDVIYSCGKAGNF